MASGETLTSDTSALYDNNENDIKSQMNLAGVSEALALLQNTDRPMNYYQDFPTLSHLLDEAERYLRDCINNPNARDLNKEAIFLRPLFQDTLLPVFQRFVNQGNWQQVDERVMLTAQALCAKIALLAGLATHHYYGASRGWEDLVLEDRRVLQGVYSVVNMMLTPTLHFMAHFRYTRLPPPPFPVSDFISAAPLNYQNAQSVYDIDDSPDTPLEHLYPINLLNLFGGDRGGNWLRVFEALRQGDRLGLEGLLPFTTLTQHAVFNLRSQFRQQLRLCVEGLAQYINQGYETAKDLSAFDDNRFVHVHLNTVLLTSCNAAAAAFGFLEGTELIGNLTRELVLRLLSSGNFAQQLAGVKDLFGLILRTVNFAQRMNNTVGLQQLLAWIEERGIVRLLLQSNLHHQQYAEAAQKVLCMLLRQGGLVDDHIDFLWQLTRDATTHEEIKANALYLLGTLAPFMSQAQRETIFKNVLAIAEHGPPWEQLKAAEFLLIIARHDENATLAEPVLNTLMELLFNPNAPEKLIAGDAVANACVHYEDAEIEGHPCYVYIGAKCDAALRSGDSPIAAAHVLLSILRGQKSEKLSTFWRDCNANAAVLQAVIKSYGNYLRSYSHFLNSKADLEEFSPAERALYSFPHDKAVDVWYRLLSEVIHKGNYFMTLEQLVQILGWAQMNCSIKSSTAAWNLLTFLVMSRKEVERAQAEPFFTKHLCLVQPAAVNICGWRCLTAYMAALSLSDWATQLKDGPAEFTAVIMIAEDPEIWSKTHDLLWKFTLGAPEMVASRAGSTLARLLVRDGRASWSQEQYLKTLEDQLRGRVDELQQLQAKICGKQAANWHDAPSAAAPLEDDNGSSTKEIELCVRQAERTVSFLNSLIDEGMAHSVPSRFSHSCSFKSFLLTLDFQFKLDLPAGQPEVSTKVRMELPANMYVGNFRKIAADRVSQMIHTQLPIPNIRLFVSGKELNNDAETLMDGRVHQFPIVHAQIAQKANVYSDLPLERRAELDTASPAYCLSEYNNGTIYSTALALANVDNGHPGAAKLRESARTLLYMLPTCPEVLETLKDVVLNANDGGSRLASLLQQGDGGDDINVKASVLLYVLQGLCVLTMPAENALLPEDTMADAEADAEVLLPKLLSSKTLDVLLSILTKNPTLSGGTPASVADSHLAMLLLLEKLLIRPPTRETAPQQQPEASEMSLDTPNNINGSLPPALINPSVIAADIGGSVVDYAVSLIHAALQGFQDSSLVSPSGVPKQQQAISPSALLLSKHSSVVLPLTQETQDKLCLTALDIMKHCVNAEPGFARLTSTTVVVAPLFHALLKHNSKVLRTNTARWLESVAASVPSIRHWVFEHVVQPLLLDPNNTNSEEIELCNKFLDTLGHSELELASSTLLTILLDQLHQAINNHQPVGCIAETVHTLLKKLRNRNLDLIPVVRALIVDCLFPEIFALRDFFMEAWRKGDIATEDLLEDVDIERFTAVHGKCLQAARGNESCRSSVYHLLEEVMTHSPSCWSTGSELLLSAFEIASEVHPKLWKNEGLSSLSPPSGFVGLQNGGATCYMNSIFQQLFMQPIIRKLILSAPAPPKEEQADSVFYQVQTMFAQLAVGGEPAYTPREFWKAFKDYDGQPVNIREHQDAYEFFTRLQDAVDEHLRSLGRPRAIFEAMGGTFAQVITVADQPDVKSVKEDDFYQISLDVRGKRNLIESLTSYVAVELMDGQNQYFSEALGKKVDAEKRVLIGRLPNTLVLHLKRFEFDYETFQRWKIKDRFELPMDLDMKPFTVEGNSTDDSSSTTHPDAYYKYELSGIVVHSGSAFAGHYYSYIRDRTGPTASSLSPEDAAASAGGWYCFDDESVHPWDPTAVDMECFGGRYYPEGSTVQYDRAHSAYMLIYERKTFIPSEAKEDKVAEQQHGPVPMQISPAVGTTTLATANAQPPVPYDMPQELYRAIMWNNLRLIATTHLVGNDLLGFMGELGLSMAKAFAVLDAEQLDQPTPSRKAARTGILASPGATAKGLKPRTAARSTTTAEDGDNMLSDDELVARRLNKAPILAIINTPLPGAQPPLNGDDNSADASAALGQVAVLCMDYIIRIVGRAPVHVINEAFPANTVTSLGYTVALHALKRSDIAAAVMRYLGNDDDTACIVCPANATYQILTQCPIQKVRRFVGNALQSAIVAVVASVEASLPPPRVKGASKKKQQQQAMIAAHDAANAAPHTAINAVDVLSPLISHLCAEMGTLKQVTYKIDELMLVLQEMGYSVVTRPILKDNLTHLISLGRPLVNAWWQLSNDDKLDCEYGILYLEVLCGAVEPFYYIRLDEEDDLGYENLSLDPLPAYAFDFFFDDPAFIRRLMMPWCIINASVAQLFKWLWMRNKKFHKNFISAILYHISADMKTLEMLWHEVRYIADIVGNVGDEFGEDRIADFMFGNLDSAEDAVADDEPRGLNSLTLGTKITWRRLAYIAIAVKIFRSDSSGMMAAFMQEPRKVDRWLDVAQQTVDKVSEDIYSEYTNTNKDQFNALSDKVSDFHKHLSLDEVQCELERMRLAFEAERGNGGGGGIDQWTESDDGGGGNAENDDGGFIAAESDIDLDRPQQQQQFQGAGSGLLRSSAYGVVHHNVQGRHEKETPLIRTTAAGAGTTHVSDSSAGATEGTSGGGGESDGKGKAGGGRDIENVHITADGAARNNDDDQVAVIELLEDDSVGEPED